jgi:hypothetical protein
MESKNMENKMNYEEFKEQEKFCRENNKPDGSGCTGCPGEYSICADNIRGLTGQINPPKFFLMKKEHNAYVWEVLAWSFNEEDLLRDLKGREDSEEWIVVDEEEFFGRLTEVV